MIKTRVEMDEPAVVEEHTVIPKSYPRIIKSIGPISWTKGKMLSTMKIGRFVRRDMKRKWNEFVQAVREMTPARGIMFLLGMGLLLWGVWVGNPAVVTFDSGFYMVLQSVATESAWAAVALVSGITTIIGVIRRDVFLVRAGAMLGFLFWLTVSIMYGIADPTVTPVVTNFVLALLHAWIFMQLKLRPETIYQNVEVIPGEGHEHESK